MRADMTDKQIDHVDHIVKAEEHLVLAALMMAGVSPDDNPDIDTEFIFDKLSAVVYALKSDLELNKN
jgi:hypothetical protein